MLMDKFKDCYQHVLLHTPETYKYKCRPKKKTPNQTKKKNHKVYQPSQQIFGKLWYQPLTKLKVFEWDYCAALVMVLWLKDLDRLLCKCFIHFHLFQQIPCVKWQNMIMGTEDLQVCKNIDTASVIISQMKQQLFISYT